MSRTGYTQEQVNIGSGPPGSKVRWFRSTSNEPRFMSTVTFDRTEGAPTLVMVHGYAASQGFFFQNFDALANQFRVIAIDQLGWGGSCGLDFDCKSTEDYVYHTLAAKSSGEIYLKCIFSFGSFAQMPLLQRASEWKVSTTFINGVHDWMKYMNYEECPLSKPKGALDVEPVFNKAEETIGVNYM